MKKILILAVVLLGATACTPEETRFWAAFHAEHPAEAEALLDELGLTAVADRQAVRSPVAEQPDDVVPAETTAAPAPEAAPEPVGLSIVNPPRDGSSLARAASAVCPGVLTLTNTGDVAYTYAAIYGPHQMPMVNADPATREYPLLEPGQTVTVDVSEAIAAGWAANVFLDRGIAFHVVGTC